MTSTPNEPRLYDVWLMWVEFPDHPGIGKPRPVVITEVDGDLVSGIVAKLTSSPQLKLGDSLPHGKDLPVETCSPPTEVLLRRFEGPRRRVPPVRRIGCFWRR